MVIIIIKKRHGNKWKLLLSRLLHVPIYFLSFSLKMKSSRDISHSPSLVTNLKARKLKLRLLNCMIVSVPEFVSAFILRHC